MNFTTTRTLAVAAMLGAASFVSFAQTETASACDAGPSALQKRVMAKSAQGVDALRDYLFVIRGTRNLSMEEAVAMVDAQRACAAVAVAAADTQR